MTICCSSDQKVCNNNSNFICFDVSNRGIRSTNETESAVLVDFQPAVITGLRVEEVDKGVSYEDGVSIVLAGATVSFILWLLLSQTCQPSKRIIDQTTPCLPVPT